jgi:hypothetical protein
MCPLQADYFAQKKRLVSGFAERLQQRFSSMLSEEEVRQIVVTADMMETANSYSPTLRMALLAACGVEERS